MRELTEHDLICARWNEVEALLDALLELPPERREAELHSRCNDAPLRAAVTQLLTLDVPGNALLDQVALALGARESVAHGGSMQGQRVGPYRIERELGEGGMGTVFLAARQTEEFTQHVALKLLRSGLFSAAQQEQFRREQQIHARLQHPHIARIYDSGISAAGVPYFAMEYIDGATLTDYCDSRRLGIQARLKLFATVCEAVAYAHQNLIVHRDLKPSNILVGDDGEPKLLDFGIAKLLPADASDARRTRTELRQLTPDYAAPEQFDGGAITTATDVFALGVLLCELLTGSRPAPVGADSSPLRASSRTMTAAVVALRDSNPGALRRRLHGDLESIVGKALQREPQRRYPGALALREDIARHLHGKPIRARPDAAAYRLGKFIQRHKIGFATSLALIATLIGATLFSLQQARIAGREAARATAEAGRANAVKSFLLDLFVGAEPGKNTPIQTADALLVRGRERVATEFRERPDLAIDVLGTIGNVERERGRLQDAHAALDDARTLARAQFGAADARTLHVEVLRAQQAHAEGRYADGRDDLGQALSAHRAAHPQPSAAVAEALDELAVLQARLRDAKAIDSALGALAMYRQTMPADATEITHALTTLGDVNQTLGHDAQALPVLEEALTRNRREFGNDHVYVAENLVMLAGVQRDLGHHEIAEARLREAVAIERKVYTEPNQNLAIAINDLAVTLVLEGELDEGGTLLAETLALYRKLYPPDHPNIATALGNLGSVRYRQGRYADAEALQREELAMDARTRAPDHPMIARARMNLARSLTHEQRYVDAQAELDRAIAADRAQYGENHVSVAADLAAQADLDAARGDSTAAAQRARDALERYAKLLPPEHPKITDVRLTLAASLAAGGDAAGASREFAQAIESAQAAKPVNQRVLARALAGAAQAALAMNDLARASAALNEAESLPAKSTDADTRRQLQGLRLQLSRARVH